MLTICCRARSRNRFTPFLSRMITRSPMLMEELSCKPDKDGHFDVGWVRLSEESSPETTTIGGDSIPFS